MASIPPPAVVEALNDCGHGIRVEFRWELDRFVHKIVGVRNGNYVPLLESIEGNEQDQYPPSPCLSQLHAQDETLFLTGATSNCHWSMSVQAADWPMPGIEEQIIEQEQIFEQFDKRYGLNAPGANALVASNNRMIVFDVACRVKKRPEKLSSIYKVQESINLHVLSSKRLAVGGKPLFGIAFGSLSGNEAADCFIENEEETSLKVIPPKEASTFPATVQWKYCVGWALE